MRKDYCVYRHTNKANGKVYIGITCQKPEARWRHGQGYKDNVYFYRAICKYGWDGFDHDILLSGLTKAEASDREVFFIALYNSTRPEYGYNKDYGGDVRGEVSEIARKNISAAQKRRFQKPEEIEKIRQSHREYYASHPMSEETKRKDSEAMKRYYSTHTRTEEHRRKISENTKKWHAEHPGVNFLPTPPTKPVNQYSTNGIFLQRWESISEAQRKTGAKNISGVCKGKCKRSGGYIWKYA